MMEQNEKRDRATEADWPPSVGDVVLVEIFMEDYDRFVVPIQGSRTTGFTEAEVMAINETRIVIRVHDKADWISVPRERAYPLV